MFFKRDENGELDRTDQYPMRLLAEAMEPCDEGQKLFDSRPPAYDFSGLVINRFYTKKDIDGRFLILQWDVGTTEGRGPHRVRTTTTFIQGYHNFESRQKRDTAFLIMQDLRVTR